MNKRSSRKKYKKDITEIVFPQGTQRIFGMNKEISQTP